MAQPVDDAEQLADRYAPIVMVRTQTSSLRRGRRAVRPDVGRPDPRQPADRAAPGRQRRPDRDAGPGGRRPRRSRRRLLPRLPRRRARHRGASTSRTTTASTPASRRWSTPTSSRTTSTPTSLALQYWLYWYYNDWNNKHESDWEFVQLLFPAGSVTEALATRADERRVRPARGRRVGRLGRRQAAARRHPSRRVLVAAVARQLLLAGGLHRSQRVRGLRVRRHRVSPRRGSRPRSSCCPDRVDSPDDPLAWIGFEGGGVNATAAPTTGRPARTPSRSGPTPVAWQDDLRDSSFVVPGDDTQRRPGHRCVLRHRRVGLGAVHRLRRLAGPRPARAGRARRRRRVPRAAHVVAVGRRDPAAAAPSRRRDPAPGRRRVPPPPRAPSPRPRRSPSPSRCSPPSSGSCSATLPSSARSSRSADPTDAGRPPGDLDDHRECRHGAAVHGHLGARGERPRRHR